MVEASLHLSRRGKDPFPLFRSFVTRVWQFLNMPKPTRAQLDLCDYLQFGPSRSIMSAFRGVGKSFITAAFVVWVLLNEPQLKIMVVSAAKDRSDAFSVFVKRLIEGMPECKHLIPRPGQRSSNVSFDVAPARPDQSPSVKSVGITGQITGSRADIIIADDIEVPKNSYTVLMRERLRELVKEFDSVIKPLPTARIIYLGTPQIESSLYNHLADHAGYSMRVWPGRIPADASRYKGRLSPYINSMISQGKRVGSPVDPQRFDDAELRRRELALGRSTFALQFMLDTSLQDGERYPLKLEDLMVLGLDKEMAPVALSYLKDPRHILQDLSSPGFQGDYFYKPGFIDEKFAAYQGSVMTVDPSGRGTNETAYAVVKHLHGRLYVTASGGLMGGYTPENLTRIAEIAKEHKVNSMCVEENYGDGMFSELLKPYLTKIWPVTLEPMKVSGQKEVRIISILEPVMQQHRLVIDKAVVERDLTDDETVPSKKLFHQITRITRDRGALEFDDRIDALALAVSYWEDKIGFDLADAAQEAHQRMLEEQLQAYEDDEPMRVAGPGRGFLEMASRGFNWVQGRR